MIREYLNELFGLIFFPLKNMGLTILSLNSVDDSINKELAVEIIAAKTPVIKIPATTGWKIVVRTSGITVSWSLRPWGPNIAIPIQPMSKAPIYAIIVHITPIFLAFLASLASVMAINLILN